MRTSPVRRLALLVAGLVVACTTPAVLPAAPSAAPTPEVAGVPANVATQAPMVRPAETAASLLLVRVEEPGPNGSLIQQQLGVLRARPIDPTTLQDIPGFTPLEFGHHYRALVSPDRRTLATIVWPSGSSNAGGVLHLIDPVAWTDRTTGVQIDESAAWLEWSKDGTQLFWMRYIGDPSLTQYAVFSADVAAPSAREVMRLPAGFQPYEARLVGSRLAVVGATDQHGLANGDASVVFVDLSTGRVSSVLPLAGLRLGQFNVSEPGLYPFRMISPGLAWDLPRARLIVVDAERAVVRIVDLAAATESGPLAIRAQAAKGPGTAKMVSTTRKVAALSSDGRWLYVSGMREDVSGQGPDAQLTPIALQRIDMTDRSETARVGGGKGLWLSSDGSRVVLFGETVTIVDTSGLRQISQIEAAATAVVAGERANVAYLAQITYSGTSTIRAVDLATGQVSATRELARHVADLVPLR
jgi:hypothetical protein